MGHRRALIATAVVAIVAAACSGSAATPAPTSGPNSQAPASQGAASEAPSASTAPIASIGPGEGELALRGEHPRGYAFPRRADGSPGTGPLVDVTEQDTSAPWAAGALVSTPGELLEFFTALIDGEQLGVGSGSTKKAAEQEAAEQALGELGVLPA